MWDRERASAKIESEREKEREEVRAWEKRQRDGETGNLLGINLSYNIFYKYQEAEGLW